MRPTEVIYNHKVYKLFYWDAYGIASDGEVIRVAPGMGTWPGRVLEHPQNCGYVYCQLEPGTPRVCIDVQWLRRNMWGSNNPQANKREEQQVS